MSETTKPGNVKQALSSMKNYCFGCLCDNNEKQLRNHTLHNGLLKELFQMETIILCYLCKRIAEHTELFIQNVQSNQIVMESFSSIMDGTLESLRTQTQPLVNLRQVSYDVIELTEKDSNNFEESSVVNNHRREKEDVEIKIEMKVEADLTLEAEFINEDDEFPEMYVKEEDDFPLSTIVKEELGIGNIDSVDLLNGHYTLKKKLKKDCVKKLKKSKKELPKVKMISITRQQCLEERKRLSEDQKYLDCVYKCTDCIKGFSFKGSYDIHMEKHNQSKGDYECEICKQRRDTEEKLIGHMRYHLIRYNCQECGLTRSCRRTIIEHYSVHHLGAEHQYVCQQCLKSFKRPSSLRKHIAYRHVRRERVQCAYCLRTYVDKEVLKSHMMMKHSKEVYAVDVCKRCICSVCGLGFRLPSQLRYHSRKHTDAREYYCVECDKSFKSEYILKTHLKTAAVHVTYKELPLSCLHCEKRFSTRRDVEQHMNRIHLNVKPFRCDRCDKAYVNLWSLNDHKRYIHDGHKRPLQYQCTMCDKAFDRNHILKSHIRTHTGERPYQCKKCPAQFSQASILRTHDRLIHLKLTRDGRPKTGAIK